MCLSIPQTKMAMLCVCALALPGAAWVCSVLALLELLQQLLAYILLLEVNLAAASQAMLIWREAEDMVAQMERSTSEQGHVPGGTGFTVCCF